ncbi:hypothetical protein AR687_08770 [Flavobacteriaceae bacterium CRH]|nr:hypothetical protein AR687_08770 [Flavobacteriaceae bacterium CRH]
MKKITCMLLLIHGGFMIAQTKTVVTPNGEKVTISPFANNGLSQNNGFTQLGGALTKASVLTTTSSNTLAIQGLQAGAATDNVLVNDSNGVLKYVPRASFTGADNLGNHIATMDLNMSNKNITNIFNAYIKNEAQIADRVTSNTNYFGIYKNNGLFGIWNNIKSTNALTIDETTNKTTLTSAQIAKGTDGGLPQPNYIATSIDDAGNIKWQNPATLPGLVSGTEWLLGGTNTDATSNKTGSIYRTGAIGIGTGASNPTTLVEINNGSSNGALKIIDGTQGNGRVLTSDANGVATWQTKGPQTIQGTVPAANQTWSPNGSPRYTGFSISVPPGRATVTAGLIVSSNMLGYTTARLSTSPTSFIQPQGVVPNYSGFTVVTDKSAGQLTWYTNNTTESNQTYYVWLTFGGSANSTSNSVTLGGTTLYGETFIMVAY